MAAGAGALHRFVFDLVATMWGGQAFVVSV
jgi:hypothetical protein